MRIFLVFMSGSLSVTPGAELVAKQMSAPGRVLRSWVGQAGLHLFIGL